jgi:hypothetical protein
MISMIASIYLVEILQKRMEEKVWKENLSMVTM